MARRARLLRWLHLTHRWLGIGLAAVVLIWTISGLVMLFAERPGLTEAERLQALAPLDMAQVRVTPAAAWRQIGETGWPEAVRLNTAFDGRPSYRFLAGGAWHSVHADDASVVPPVSDGQAVVVAAALPGAADATWHAVGQIAQDYWTRSPRFDAQRPFVLLHDGSGRAAYVAQHTGELVFESTRPQRLFERIGTGAHWLWLFSTDIGRDTRRWVMLTLGFASLVMVASGVWVGMQRLRPSRRYPGGRWSPYRDGWKRWHHLLGLASSVFLLAWLVSGWLSYSPFGWVSGGVVSAGERAWMTGGRIDASTLAALPTPDKAGVADGKVREIEWSRFAGETLLLVRGAGRSVAKLASTSSTSSAPLTQEGLLTVDAIARRVAGLLPSARLLNAERIDGFDAEYFPHRHRSRPLPVVRLRFDDAAQTVYYVDPANGRIEARVDAHTRTRRWAFGALHRFDFPPFDQSFAWRSALATAALLATMVLGIGGCVLGWKRLSHS